MLHDYQALMADFSCCPPTEKEILTQFFSSSGRRKFFIVERKFKRISSVKYECTIQDSGPVITKSCKKSGLSAKL